MAGEEVVGDGQGDEARLALRQAEGEPGHGCGRRLVGEFFEV